MPRLIRTSAAYLAAPIMAATGFRFSKDYRWETTRFHVAVYATCSTVLANYLADDLAGFKKEGMLERRANAPLKPKQDQRPCDAGLFSDDARQLDLVTLCQSKPSK